MKALPGDSYEGHMLSSSLLVERHLSTHQSVVLFTGLTPRNRLKRLLWVVLRTHSSAKEPSKEMFEAAA